MFPWQSGSEGKEETQRVHLNPLSGRWEPDLSHNQRHVNAAIFYNIWRHFQATDDVVFLRDHGAEMMLEIARFWASIAHFNPERERYEIHGVMGPDEFHDRYPDADQGGLRNNAYTNVMVAWLCDVAQQVLSLLPGTRADALRGKLTLGDEELRRWADMSRRMFVPVPRRRHHQSVRGLRGSRRARLGRLPSKVREHPATGPDPARRRRRSEPLQARQAGRHGDAVLPVLAR